MRREVVSRAQGDADSEEIRAALLRRLSDAKEDVRGEAVVGLGKRRDQRVLPALIASLEQESCTNTAIEAACFMLNPEDARGDWGGRDYAAALRQRFQL
ncbi:MAG TPA: HEAT repeat domain-containing protein [Stellaceae bacterium]